MILPELRCFLSLLYLGILSHSTLRYKLSLGLGVCWILHLHFQAYFCITFFISISSWEVFSITFFLLLVEHLMLYLHVFINLPCGNMFFHNCLSSSITHIIMPQTRIQYTSTPYIFSYKFLHRKVLYTLSHTVTNPTTHIAPWCYIHLRWQFISQRR